MSARSHVLYSTLLSDLSQYLDSSTLLSLEKGEAVDYWPGMGLKEFSSLRLASNFMKKFVTAKKPDADSNALKKFTSVNLQCGTYHLQLRDSLDELLVGELKSSIYKFLYPRQMPLVSSFNEILSRGNVGPGANVNAIGGDFYSKMYSSPLSCTSEGLYIAYRSYVTQHPLWFTAEETRSQTFGLANIVEGNRLRFVPKRTDISRVICVEPTLNMFFQLGLGNILTSRLKSFYSIDLSTQPHYNKEMARIGSFRSLEQNSGDDQFCTIDLESASDSIAVGMLKEFLPPRFLSWLLLLRSPTAELPNGERIAMNMVSTMGNGFTFPLQTMLFASVVSAAYRSLDIPLVLQESCGAIGRQTANFGVFGDDIVILAKAKYRVLRLLHLLGFKVNADKSFFEGPFRESCGGDFFQGHPVRPVFVKKLDTQQDLYSLINSLNDWSAYSNISLPNTVQYLLGRCRWQPVPVWENPDSGIRIPSSMLTQRSVSRNGSLLYARSISRPKQLVILEDRIRLPRRERRRIFNPSGLYISFLQGCIRRHRITIRNDSVRYSTKLGIAPNWDMCPAMPPIAGGVDWQRWNTAVYRNFNL